MVKNMNKENIILSNNISSKSFCELRETVGFQKLNSEQAECILSNTTYIISAVYYEKYIGLARLLFDYGTDAYITDVIVHPDYQGYGIGSILINNIFDYIKSHSYAGLNVACSLYANIGKEAFYEKFGFKKLPNSKYGYGMLIEV